MQALSSADYRYLADIATRYRDKHLREMKLSPHFNPALGVDALCFHRVDEVLVGALITPIALWLVAVPAQAKTHIPPAEGTCYRLSLPSGEYRLEAELLEPPFHVWRCCILEDLKELQDMGEAARLAQAMMTRLMQVDDTK
ncbi:[NiFe]-hydrogenase assembly chaperone HybE [Halomonas sp. Bachu 37]|uniref:[NiFe]-hydrogenase assembly chaperone HybE n=1 Tax=Halomonas kashgarensis TaxID=3084920 RepID=UPI0032177A59